MSKVAEVPSASAVVAAADLGPRLFAEVVVAAAAGLAEIVAVETVAAAAVFPCLSIF